MPSPLPLLRRNHPNQAFLAFGSSPTPSATAPHLRPHRGSICVVKLGGHAMTSPANLDAFAGEILALQAAGIRPVVVHGGGPQIDAQLTAAGLEPRFAGGLRVTCPRTMAIVEMVLSGHINKDIAARIGAKGGNAAGLSGRDAGLLRCLPAAPVMEPTPEGPRPVSLGLVGDIARVNPAVLVSLLRAGVTPVIAPVGCGPGGMALNVNADTAAAKIAATLGAAKLIMLSDVDAVRDATGAAIRHLTVAEALALIATGTATGGMIPKLKGCVAAVREGVRAVHIVDGRVAGAVMQAFPGREGGTCVSNQPAGGPPAPAPLEFLLTPRESCTRLRS